MPRTWTIQDYKELPLSRRPVSLNATIEANWNQHQNWEWTHNTNVFSPSAAQTRLFYPRSFTASSSLNALNTPWFIDYGHLTFWFFFLCTFLLVMWLVTLHNLTSKNVETRWPRRETRGFSRAQAGDVMTAVLPLTWSVTMLLHASTHSLNFDENTAATTFSFTVMAYQWGWNYYFPKDIVEKLANGPRLVGRNHIDLNGGGVIYNRLLEKARHEYLSRLAIRGGYADRFGRDTVPHLLNIFFRPSGNPTINANSSLINGMFVAANSKLETKNTWRLGVDSKNKAKIINTTPFLDSNTISQLWLSSSIVSRRSAKNTNNFYRHINNFQFKTRRHLYQRTYLPTFLNQSQHITKLNTTNPITRSNTARSAVSFALMGNRLSLIHKHLTKSNNLDKFINRKFVYAAFIRKLTKQSSSFGPLHAALPSWVFAKPTYTPVKMNNIKPNLNLMSLPIQSNAISQFIYNLSTWESNKKICQIKKLNKTTSLRSLSFFNSNGTFNSMQFLQKIKYSGTPYTRNFISSSSMGFEDVGLNNNSVVKQLNLKNAAYLVKALNNYKTLTSSRNTHKNLKQNTTPVKFFTVGDINNTRLNQYAVCSENYLPLTPNATNNLMPTTRLQAFMLNNAGIATSKPTYKLASTLPVIHLSNLYSKITAINYNISLSLQLKNSTTTKVWTNAINPFDVSGSQSSILTKSQTLLQKLTPLTYVYISTLPNEFKLITRKQVAFFNKNFIFAANTNFIASPIYNKFVKSFSFVLYPHTKNSCFSLTNDWKFNGVGLTLSTKKHNNQVIDIKATKLLNTNTALIYGKPVLKKMHVFSSWLEGVELTKPTRSSLDRTRDILNFGGKSDFLNGQKYIQHNGLFDWYWSWSNATQLAALPTSKLFRGTVAKRAVGGFWNTGWANDVISQAAVLPEDTINLHKQAFTTIIPSLKKITRTTLYPHLTSAVLDNEWVKLAHVPLCITPEPYEDLDQSFIHQKWAFEINTTRRSDHISKFKTTWGPFSMTKSRKNEYTQRHQAQRLLSSVGPSVFSTLPLKAIQKVALTNDAILTHKNTTGLLPIIAQSTSGFFTLNQNIGSFSYNNLTGTTALTKNSLFIITKLASKNKHKTQRTMVTPGYWTTLWRFKTNIADAQLLVTQPHISAHSTYWQLRALLTLSLRADLELSARRGGLKVSPKITQRSVGFFTNLVQDINYLGAKSSSSVDIFQNSWKRVQWRGLESKVESLLDKTINAHLLARSGHSLANDEIGTIRRLRVTKGIYLPSDIPMHAVCASKDVIHSWALPGLNIKIDCIPGYNSHRRLMLRWRGAYWGQCMEVCGRYHHWMPILVNVVHKDIFLAWCLTYIKQLDARSLSNSKALQTVTSIDFLNLELVFKQLIKSSNAKAQIKPTQFITMVTYELDV